MKVKGMTTAAIIVSLAALAGCGMHGSNDRYSHGDRSDYQQDRPGYNRSDNSQRPGMDGRHDGRWNSSDKNNRERDWQNHNRNDGSWDNRSNRS